MAVLLTTTSASAQTFTSGAMPPAGTSITVGCWGPGSGGSRGTSNGSGGAGGAYVSSPYILTPNDVANGISYLLPPGGTGAGAANPTAPGDTSWSTNNINLTPNTTNIGTVVGTIGSGGALPTGILGTNTGWFTGLDANLSFAIIAFGTTSSGLPYTDFRMWGTTSGASTNVVSFGFCAQGAIGAGVSCTAQFSHQLIAGSTTNISTIAGEIWCATSSTGPLSTIGTTGFTPTGTLTSFTCTGTTVASTAVVTPRIYLQTTGAAAIDITLRIAGIQCEQAASATFYKSTPGYCLAKGGGSASGTTGGTGGAAASCVPTNGEYTGAVAFSGGNGATRTQGGGGGGAGGAGGAGGSATSATGGTGDGGAVTGSGTSDARGGSGGLGSTSAATAGGAPGAGGGGQTSGSSGTGGAGGPAQIQLTWTNNAAATASFFTLSVVSSASQFDRASTTLSIEVLTASGSVSQFDIASASASVLSLSSVAYVSDWSYGNTSLLGLSASGSAGQVDRASSVSSFEVFSASGAAAQFDSANATCTITFSASAQATQFALANGLASFFSISDVAKVSDWSYGVATIPGLSATAAAGQINNASSTDAALSLNATGQVSQYDQASGVASFGALSSQASISLWSYGSGAFALSAVGQATQYDQASGAVTFAALSASGTLLSTATASSIDVVLGLAAVGQANQYDNASGLATFAAIGAQASISLWSYGSASLALSVTGRAAQFDQVSGALTFAALSAQGSLSSNTFASSVNTVLSPSATGQAGQNDSAAGLASFGTLSAQASISLWAYETASLLFSASGQISQYDQASATLTFAVLSASGGASSSTAANGLASFEALSATAQAGQDDRASGVTTVLPLSAIGQSPDWAFATNSLFVLSAEGSAGLGSVCFIRANFFPLSTVATAQIPIFASGVASLPQLTASGSISTAAYGAGTIAISTAGLLGQSDHASASVSANFSASGVIANWATALVQLPSISASGQAVLGVVATGSPSITLAAAGTAQQFVNATATASLLVLGALGSLVQQDTATGVAHVPGLTAGGAAVTQLQAAASFNIYFSASGLLSHTSLASAVVSWDLSGTAAVSVSQLTAGIAPIIFGGIGFAFQGAGVPAWSLATIPTLSAVGTVRSFTSGRTHQVWFDEDDRVVYWPPWVPRNDNVATKRAVWWGR